MLFKANKKGLALYCMLSNGTGKQMASVYLYVVTIVKFTRKHILTTV